MVQFVVALVGVPGALPVWEEVTCALDRWRRWRGPRRFGDADSLIDIDEVGIRNAVIGSETLQVDVVVGGYSPQGIAARNYVDAIATGARGFCKYPKYVGPQRVTQQKHAKDGYYTYMPYYDAYCPVPLKIVPDSLVYVHKLSSAK